LSPCHLVTFLAWCVHFYTALGLVAAAGIAVLLFRGDPEAFRWCFVLMLVATLIDATDGSLARAVRIKEVLPGFDGRRLDDLVDFLTYTSLPLLLIWRAGILPEGLAWVLLLPLLASAYGFSQVSAKTDDGYFLGFPSYWNLVAFYLYVLRPWPGWLSVGLVVVLALLTFVPSRYLYPTGQRGLLSRVTNVLGALWGAVLVWVLWRLLSGRLDENATDWWAVASLIFPLYYLVASWAVSLRLWRSRPGRRREEVPGGRRPVLAGTARRRFTFRRRR
jgi:phosphatidylcholine synthase